MNPDQISANLKLIFERTQQEFPHQFADIVNAALKDSEYVLRKDTRTERRYKKFEKNVEENDVMAVHEALLFIDEQRTGFPPTDIEPGQEAVYLADMMVRDVALDKDGIICLVQKIVVNILFYKNYQEATKNPAKKKEVRQHLLRERQMENRQLNAYITRCNRVYQMYLALGHPVVLLAKSFSLVDLGEINKKTFDKYLTDIISDETFVGFIKQFEDTTPKYV